MKQILDKILDKIIDIYLTWITAENKEERAYRAWCIENIHSASPSVQGRFTVFKHIIEVDWNKIYSDNPMLGYNVRHDFRQTYMFPARELGDHCMVTGSRGKYNIDGDFIDDEFGSDNAFVGTNNDEDAVMIALKYK